MTRPTPSALQRAGLLCVMAAALVACSAAPAPAGSASARAGTSVSTNPSAGQRTAPSPSSTPIGQGGVDANVYAHTAAGDVAPSLAHLAARVYVPDEGSSDVVIIDPETFAVVRRLQVGSSPEHVTPDWDLRRLYVNDMLANRLTVIDPRTGKVVRAIHTPTPYNLYFTLDGSKAIVVQDSTDPRHEPNGLRFYDRTSWRSLGFLRVPYPGADHLDFSADGRYLFLSCEYSGEVVRVDTRTMKLAGHVHVGGLPVDVRLAPAGDVFFVANQGRNGVSIIDSRAMRAIGFIHTADGAHGLALSRDTTRLYVTNRRAGTISVIGVANLRVIATWAVGGSPDMMAISPDGTQLWVSNRYSGFVSVVDTRSGEVLRRIRTGVAPHGLSFWPQPGRFSLGHNGNMR